MVLNHCIDYDMNNGPGIEQHDYLAAQLILSAGLSNKGMTEGVTGNVVGKHPVQSRNELWRDSDICAQHQCHFHNRNEMCHLVGVPLSTVCLACAVCASPKRTPFGELCLSLLTP